MPTANINGFEMAYRDEGNGPVLLLIHAFPLAGVIWNPQVAEWRQDYRLIIPDLRGFGQSAAGAPTDRYSSVDEYADDLAALLLHLGLNTAPVTLIGLSMGGYVAFAFWRRYPEQVRAIVLANTRSEADSEEGRQNRYRMIEAVRQQGAEAAVEAMLPRLLAPATYNLRPDLVADVGATIRANPPAGIIAAAGALAARPDSTPDLPNLNRPCLVVAGQDDQLTPPAQARIMTDRLPDWQLSLVPHAGHLSNLENPEFFNQAVLTFLKEVHK